MNHRLLTRVVMYCIIVYSLLYPPLFLFRSLTLHLYFSSSLYLSFSRSYFRTLFLILFNNSFIYFLLAYFLSLSSFFLSFPEYLFRWRKQRFWNNQSYPGKDELLVFPNMMMTQWTAIRKMMKKMKVSWFSPSSHHHYFLFFSHLFILISLIKRKQIIFIQKFE